MTPGQKTALDCYAICEKYNTTLERVKQVRRVKRNDLLAIRELCKYLHEQKQWSPNKVGVYLDRDHKTIRLHLGLK